MEHSEPAVSENPFNATLFDVKSPQISNAISTPSTQIHRRIILISVVAAVLISSLSVTIPQLEGLVIEVSRLTLPSVPPDIAPDIEQRRWEEFSRDVEVSLGRARDREQEALALAEKRLGSLFDRYRNGITPLVKELTGFRTRASILKAALQDIFDGRSRAQEIVQTAFARHLFSQEKLLADVHVVLESFQEDLYAARNRLLSEVHAAAVERGIPKMMLPDIGEFSRAVESRAVSLLKERIRRNVVQAAGTFAASTASGIATELIVKRVAQRLAVQLATRAGTTAATAGGAVAAGAAGGATLGSWIPGPGTIVGVIAGLVVGGIVDHSMAEAAERELHESLTGFINDIQHDLLEASDGPRFRQSLQDGLESLHSAEADILRHSVHEGRNGV